MGYGIQNLYLLISWDISTKLLQSLLSVIWRGHTPSFVFGGYSDFVYHAWVWSVLIWVLFHFSSTTISDFCEASSHSFLSTNFKNRLVYFLSSTLLTIPVCIYLTMIFFYSCTNVVLFIFLISLYSWSKYHNSYRAVFEKAQTLTEWASVNLLAPFLLRTLLAIGNKFQ